MEGQRVTEMAEWRGKDCDELGLGLRQAPAAFRETACYLRCNLGK